MSSVFTHAGQSTDTLTLDPISASSWCIDSDNVTTPCLATSYVAAQGADTRPATEAVLTTWHSLSCFSMIGTKTRMPWSTPQRLTPSTHCQSASVNSQDAPTTGGTPALLQRMWTAPNASIVLAARASTSAARETSVRTGSTVAPPAFISDAVLARAPSSTSARTTFIPSAAKRSAIARPMPLAAPVTTAVLPLNSFMPPPFRISSRTFSPPPAAPARSG